MTPYFTQGFFIIPNKKIPLYGLVRVCTRFSFGSFCCWLLLLDVLFLIDFFSLHVLCVSFLLICLFDHERFYTCIGACWCSISYHLSCVGFMYFPHQPIRQLMLTVKWIQINCCFSNANNFNFDSLTYHHKFFEFFVEISLIYSTKLCQQFDFSLPVM